MGQGCSLVSCGGRGVEVKAMRIMSKEGQEKACKRTQYCPGEKEVTNAHFQMLQV